MPLFDVRPSLTADHFDDRVGLDAVFASQCGFGDAACGEAGADVPDIIRGKFPHAGAMNLSPSRSDGEPLALRGFSHVSSVTPDAEVVRSNARRGVALVENVTARRDRAVRQFPCHAMGAKTGDHSVAMGLQRAGPQPACTAFVDAIPERCKDALSAAPSLTRCTAEALTRASGLDEYPAALRADLRLAALRSDVAPATTETSGEVLDIAGPHPERIGAASAGQGNLARHRNAAQATILSAHQDNPLVSRPRPAPTGAGVLRVHYTTGVPLWFYI